MLHVIYVQLSLFTILVVLLNTTLPKCLMVGRNSSRLSVMLPSTELLSWLPSAISVFHQNCKLFKLTSITPILYSLTFSSCNYTYPSIAPYCKSFITRKSKNINQIYKFYNMMHLPSLALSMYQVI